MELLLIILGPAVLTSIFMHAILRADAEAGSARQWQCAAAATALTCFVNGLVLGWLGAAAGAAFASLGGGPNWTDLLRLVAMAAMFTVPAALPIGLVVGFCRSCGAKDHARRVAGACGNCGYNLTGNVSGVCPECGAAISPRQHEAD